MTSKEQGPERWGILPAAGNLSTGAFHFYGIRKV